MAWLEPRYGAPSPQNYLRVKILDVQDPGCVVVFSKPAVPGRVKTRLVGELSSEQAADLHQAFLDDLLERLAGSAHEIRIAWALEGGETQPASEFPAMTQQGRDLGERLFDALSRAGREHRWCAAVGSDHPELPVCRVDKAFELLGEGADLVLGPAEDGGYYLVAARRETLRPEIFADIPWSTSRVLEATVERSELLGLRLELLPPGHDVDTPEDLPRLASYLADHPGECPRTRELFERWGLVGEQ